MKDFEPVMVKCACNSSDHIALFYFNSEDKEAYLSLQMSNHKGIFGRIREAIKYVFKKECKYGHWDETLLDEAKLLNLS